MSSSDYEKMLVEDGTEEPDMYEEVFKKRDWWILTPIALQTYFLRRKVRSRAQ
jgi:hypothetical protein